MPSILPSGKTYSCGVFEEEFEKHKPSALADITYYKPRIPGSFNLLALLLERIPKKTRTCLMCRYCASDSLDTNQWCSIVKNGSKRKGTFNESKGSYCSFFETGISTNPQNDLVEGDDYTIWINPKHCK